MEEKSIMRLLEYEDTSKLLFQKANELLHDQNNVDMIEKLKTLINALANVSKLFQCQEKETLLRETNQLLPLLKAPYSLKANEKLQYWIFLFLETVDAELLLTLNNYIELSAETGNALYDYIEHRKKFKYYVLLLTNTALRTGYSLPEKTYNIIMEAVQQQPDLLGYITAHKGYVYEQTPQRTFHNCTVCGGEGTPYYTSFSYFMNHFENPFEPVKTWIKCNHCGNLFTRKFPEEFLKQCEHYELMSPNITPDISRFCCVSKTSSQILSIWCNILNELHKYTKGKSLLEVGIGTGELLAVAIELGYDTNAVELRKDRAQEIANMLSIPIWSCDFLKFESEKKFDILTMGDIIEHVTNPKLALEKAYSLLKEDGVLWLSTPNYNSAFTQIMKFRDAMWKEPEHISYFHFKGLESLANDVGFVIQEYQVSKRYNGSMELILTKKSHTS